MSETLFRSIQIRASGTDEDEDDDDFVSAVLSTDSPVERGEGFSEVLLHSPSAIDLSRAPLPLLTSHDASAVPVGIVEGLTTDGRRLRGRIRFGRSARARELHADVKAGVVRSLSIGYRILSHKLDGNTVIATRWQPHEASAVSVPADTGAGFFRSLTPPRNFHMENDTDAGGETRSQRIASRRQAELELAAGGAERTRAAEIAALANRHGMSNRVADWLTAGTSLEQIRAEILETRATRPMRQPAAEELDAARTRSESRARPAAGGPIPLEELRKYSLLRAIRAQVMGADDRRYTREAGFELEVSRTLSDHCDRAPKGLMVPEEVIYGVRRVSSRAMSVGVPTAGGDLVATDLLAGEFIDTLNASAQVLRLGARRLSGLVGNVAIPRMTAGSAVNWIGEGADYGETAPTFDQLMLTPHDCSARTDITRRLMIQSTPAAEDYPHRSLFAELNGHGPNHGDRDD